jgi:hypothetical protein
MLTFGGQDFQYFRVGLFDFHRARAPDRLLDIGKTFRLECLVARLCCFVDLGIVAEQLDAPLARQIDDVRVRPGPANSGLSPAAAFVSPFQPVPTSQMCDAPTVSMGVIGVSSNGAAGV